MIQLTVLYGHPQDPAAFDRYYRDTHADLARKIRELRGYTITKPTSFDSREQSPYYLIANLYFESEEEMQIALHSPEGQAVIGDVPRFASGGAALLIGEVQVYDPVVIG